MSTVVSKNVQIGADGTASNNFTAYQPATPDGTLRIGNGNSGSVTDAITLTSAGNVGIGTTSPNNNSGYGGLTLNGTTGGILDIKASGSDVLRMYGTAAQSMLRTTTATPLLFGTDDAERMRITSGGSVGIGTSSPSQKMSVSSSATDVTAINLVNTSSGGGNYNIGAVGSAGWVGGSAGSLVIRDSLVGATRVVLDSSGNLGLGNTPSATSAAGYTAFELGTSAGTGLTGNNGDLYVSENAYVNGGAWKYAASSIASAQYNLGGGVHRWFNAAAGTAGNAISFTQAMTLTAAGDLGIGNTSPTQKLDVTGTVKATAFVGDGSGLTGAGKVLQVVTGTHSSSAGSTSTSYSDTGLSATITPSSSSNKILVLVYMPGLYKAATTNGTAVGLLLLRDATTVLVSANCFNNASHQQLGIFSASALDTPSTTSATVYKLQFRSNDGNYVLVNTDSYLSTITLLEIAA